MDYEYGDGYRAAKANEALKTVLAIFNIVSTEKLTHRDRNNIDETVKIIIAVALKESAKERTKDPTGIPF